MLPCHCISSTTRHSRPAQVDDASRRSPFDLSCLPRMRTQSGVAVTCRSWHAALALGSFEAPLQWLPLSRPCDQLLANAQSHPGLNQGSTSPGEVDHLRGNQDQRGIGSISKLRVTILLLSLHSNMTTAQLAFVRLLYVGSYCS